jgi:hypothetical protein
MLRFPIHRFLRRTVMPLLAMLPFAAASACATEDSVMQAIDEANYCAAADECVVIFPGCHVGCWAVVNVAEEGRIQDLVDSYDDQQNLLEGPECLIDCDLHTEPTCDGGECVVETFTE